MSEQSIASAFQNNVWLLQMKRGSGPPWSATSVMKQKVIQHNNLITPHLLSNAVLADTK